jgi:hypothetical protein
MRGGVSTKTSSKILRSAHTVYLCVLYGSQKRKIISLHSINWPVFITETECVYCAVRTEYLNTIQINFILQDFEGNIFLA